MGQLLVVVQSRLKEIQTLVQLELIPGPVWLACRLLPKWYRTWDKQESILWQETVQKVFRF